MGSKHPLSNEEQETLTEILDYLYNDDYEVESESLLDVEEIIDKMWKDSSYTLLEAVEFFFASEFIYKAPLHYVQTIFKDAGIIMTSKDRKRGRKAIFRRFLTKYHKPNVYGEFQSLTRGLHLQALGSLYGGLAIDKKHIDKLIEEAGFFSVLHVALDNEATQPEILELLQENFTSFMLGAKIKFYLFLNHLDYETVMDHPEQLTLVKAPDTNALTSENKMLKRKVKIRQREKKNLQEQVHSLQQEKKKVEGENYRLYKESLDEIQALESELEKVKAAHEEEVITLLQIIDELSTNLDQTDAETSSKSHSLNGKKICLVGGSRIRHFRHITERYDGEMVFVAEDEFKAVRGAASQADAVFFLKELASHSLQQETISAAREFDVPFYYLNSKGTSRFEQDLIKYMEGELIPLA